MCEESNCAANQLPIKTPLCYTPIQTEVLQTFGNFTIATQYETDEFLQNFALFYFLNQKNRTAPKTIGCTVGEKKFNPSAWTKLVLCPRMNAS